MRRSRRLYVLASDGYLHTLDLSTGGDADPPIQVLPLPYGKPYGLNLVNDVLYTVTGQGCGGVPNALYAVNLKNKKLTVSAPPQAGLWGTAGPAVGTDGTIYFESGDGPYDASTGKLSTSVEAFTFADDQPDPQGLLLPQQPYLAFQKRSGYERHPCGVSPRGTRSRCRFRQGGSLFPHGQQIPGWGRTI